jgi:hypothetical protein
MKKQLLLLVSLVTATFAMAQEKPSFGIKAGVTSSGVSGDAVSSLQSLMDFTNGGITSKNRTGLFAGTYASVPLGGIFSVEPGIYYAQKGYEMKGELSLKGAEFLGANAKAALNTHYIDLPVVLKANINGFQVFAGPQVSYLAKADLRTTAGVLGFNLLNKKLDATQQFNRWDAAITGGIGYDFGNGVNITAAYDHGLARADANQSLNAYNRTIKVGVGFSF